MSGPRSSKPGETALLRKALAKAEAALAKERVEATNREQARLAQALHDSVCQSLSGVYLLARVIARKIETPPQAAEEMKELCEMLNRASKELNDLVRWLRPATINSGAELSPDLAEHIFHRVRHGHHSPSEPFEDRELEILRLLGKAQTNTEIAVALGISLESVQSDHLRLQEKLGLAR